MPVFRKNAAVLSCVILNGSGQYQQFLFYVLSMPSILGVGRSAYCLSVQAAGRCELMELADPSVDGVSGGSGVAALSTSLIWRASQNVLTLNVSLGRKGTLNLLPFLEKD